MKRSKNDNPARRDTAEAIAAWASSRAPDEVGTIADAIWGLAQRPPGGFPELAEGARAVLATEPGGPSGLVLLASLLEQTAQRLRAAADTLDDGRAKAPR